jgi:phosphatidylserine synthase
MKKTSPTYYLHHSNTLTYGSLLTGLFAVITAKEFSSWHLSGALIAASTALDTLDGRFARLFSRNDNQKAFGKQFDSLVDAVVFGFVPVACMYLLLDFDSSISVRLWWSGAAFAYIVSALTRLGCFNLHQADENHFVGIPTTLSALMLSTLFFVSASPGLSMLALVVCAYAMLAPIALPRPRGAALAVFVVWSVLVFALHLFEASKEQRPIVGETSSQRMDHPRPTSTHIFPKLSNHSTGGIR